MQIAVSHYSYFRLWRSGDLSVPQFLDLAATLGVQAEIVVPMLGNDEELDNSPVPIAGIGVSNDFAKPDLAPERDKVLRGIDLAAKHGSKWVRVFAGNVAPDVEFSAVRNTIVENLRDMAERAEEAGVTLALENHGMLAGRAMDVLGIIRDVDSPALLANPDTGNFRLVDEDPVEAIVTLQGKCATAHLKDVMRQDDDPMYRSLAGIGYRGCTLGTGEVDLGACLNALNLPVASIEFAGTEEPLVAVPQSIEYVRSLL